MTSQRGTYQLWKQMAARPGGSRVFSAAAVLPVPYFASIVPHVRRMEPGFSETAGWPRPTLIAMMQILLRAVVLLGSWAIGLLVAAWVVPGVSVSVSGFIVAVIVFSVPQTILSLLILKLPREYATLFLGGTALALTLVALTLASVFTHGLTIDGTASWVGATVLVWLVTTLAAISLPKLFAPDEAGWSS